MYEVDSGRELKVVMYGVVYSGAAHRGMLSLLVHDVSVYLCVRVRERDREEVIRRAYASQASVKIASPCTI